MYMVISTLFPSTPLSEHHNLLTDSRLPLFRVYWLIRLVVVQRCSFLRMLWQSCPLCRRRPSWVQMTLGMLRSLIRLHTRRHLSFHFQKMLMLLFVMCVIVYFCLAFKSPCWPYCMSLSSHGLEIFRAQG